METGIKEKYNEEIKKLLNANKWFIGDVEEVKGMRKEVLLTLFLQYENNLLLKKILGDTKIEKQSEKEDKEEKHDEKPKEHRNDGLWTHLDFVTRHLDRYNNDELKKALSSVELFDLAIDPNAHKWKKIIQKELEKRNIEEEVKELQTEYMDNVKCLN